MSLGATARCRQSNIRRIALALFISSLLILTCPSPSRAQTLAHPPILIVGDQSFTPDNGVTNGNGTLQAPYIIENWEITSDTTAGIEIMNTNSYFVIRDVFIHPSHITPDSSGILLQNTLNGRVENSRIANFTYGVQLSLASQDSITSNRIIGRRHRKQPDLQQHKVRGLGNQHLQQHLHRQRGLKQWRPSGRRRLRHRSQLQQHIREQHSLKQHLLRVQNNILHEQYFQKQ